MENNNKIIVPTIIAVLTLLILTVGATYSYFLITSTNNFGTKTITASTPAIGSVALTTGDNLTMSLTASQMMAGNSDIEYYASSNGTKTTATTTNIGVASVVGEGKYTCSYTLTINDNENSLYDAFQNMATKSTGQIVLSINGSDYDFNTSNLFSKTITRTMTGLTKNTPQNITAELKLVNKVDIDQSDLADKELTLTFTASNFSCTAEESNKGVDYILNNSSSEDLWNGELEKDGIRYVGTNPDNYICFGYNDALTDCDFTNITNTDLYAYRIIGVFENDEGEQHLKLIKKEALNTKYNWNTDYQKDITWEESDLYNGINGSYFLTNPTYSYMQDSAWTNKIATWNYTATNTKTYESSGMNYNNSIVRQTYLHEMDRSTKTSSVGVWDTVPAKIGLMYVSDYQLSLGSTAIDYINSTTMRVGWIHIGNNDSSAPSTTELTMTSYGLANSGIFMVWNVNSNGSVGFTTAIDLRSVRPVFYLTSDITITGEGSIANPFIVS